MSMVELPVRHLIVEEVAITGIITVHTGDVG